MWPVRDFERSSSALLDLLHALFSFERDESTAAVLSIALHLASDSA